MIALPYAFEVEGLTSVYCNIETTLSGPDFNQKYAEMLKFTKQSPLPFDADIWGWRSTWRKPPEYDQDQRRLYPITIARNMARAYALDQDMDYLLFIDADVIVEPDGLQKLLSLNKPLTGGLVPGRGAHAHTKEGRPIYYVFGAEATPQDPEFPEAVVCRHGSCGYMLIRRDLFSTLAFRFGASRANPNQPLSEDPAFAEDAQLNGFGPWYIHKEARARHWDDPKNPFTGEQAADDFKIPV
jgi:hypothetical protein